MGFLAVIDDQNFGGKNGGLKAASSSTARIDSCSIAGLGRAANQSMGQGASELTPLPFHYTPKRFARRNTSEYSKLDN